MNFLDLSEFHRYIPKKFRRQFLSVPIPTEFRRSFWPLNISDGIPMVCYFSVENLLVLSATYFYKYLLFLIPLIHTSLSLHSLLQIQKKSRLLKIIIVRGWINLIWIQTPSCLPKNTHKVLEIHEACSTTTRSKYRYVKMSLLFMQ